MQKRKMVTLTVAISATVAFVLWTTLLSFVDVQTIGPQNSKVGFATINGFIHRFTGVNMKLYLITDWLGLIPIFIAFGFAILGLAQWIKRKTLRKVDYSLFVLGGFYIVVFSVYLLFEYVVINYRPVLINGILEASYPSSTTMLVLCFMPTAIMQCNARITNKLLRNTVKYTTIFFIIFMVLGRFLSGVHWFSDILGGGLLSVALVSTYVFISRLKTDR